MIPKQIEIDDQFLGVQIVSNCIVLRDVASMAAIDGSLLAEPTDLQLGALAGLADCAAGCKSHEVRGYGQLIASCNLLGH